MFAYCLAAVAGYVDALGYMITGGFFVSFMSGNSTRMAVSLSDNADAALLGLILIGSFVIGVTAGASVGRIAGERRATAILAFVAALLTVTAALLAMGRPHASIPLVAFAMGAVNTVFAEGGEVRIGLTYMTGALVRLGKAIAAALFGGDRLGWTPHVALWLSLVIGASVGAASFVRIGDIALWGAAGAMAVLALLSPAFRLSQRLTPPPA